MKIKNLIYIMTAMLFMASFTLKADDAPAQEAYTKGDYATAIRLWEQARTQQGVSSELFYNLGNAYSKAGNQGGAVLNYEKALRMNPYDSRAKNNLKYAENLVQIANESLTEGKNMDPTPEDAGFIDNILSLIAALSSNTWAVLALIWFVVTIAGVVAYIFSGSVVIKKVGFFGGSISLILCALTIWCAILSKRSALDTTTAILMGNEVNLLLKPQADAKPVATPLSAGTRLKIMKTDTDNEGVSWTEVYLNAEYSGWVRTSEIAVIEIPELTE